MEKVIVRQMVVGPWEVFTYLVACSRTGKAVLIDPAGEPERLESAIRENAFEVTFILNTHGHPDHVLANRTLRSRLKVPVCMHWADDEFFVRGGGGGKPEGPAGLPPSDPADRLLEDGETIRFGEICISVLHTPGHSPGSVCYLVEGNLFTGDTLFVGAVGRTDIGGGSFETLLSSISDKILILPPETVIWPGHDYGDRPTSTVGREMRENPYITDFILDARGQ